MATPQGPFYQALGKNIRVARTSAGITQSGLATAIGLTRTSVTNIESGKQPIEVHVLFRIAETLQCDVSTLVANLSSLSEQTSSKLAGLPVDVKAWVTKVIAKPEGRRAR